ncbi:hypothetical protein FRB96_009338 [Tulasnella sp. 330]|nr:hypothetical protein FRB96_009338 [Tulasnella sp. 330]KAG8887592.1 hypothetical protein FRB98_009320 [Tulasnella sp. 332]
MNAAGPSQFAQLFKRSKFATFDPSIAQIYTTYAGYAHRGDYGLKRPLPPTARGNDPMIHIRAIDTPEEQTEWSTARNQGKWIRRFDEGGAGAEPAPKSKWSRRGDATMRWEVDSAFSPAARKLSATNVQAMVPNLEAMNEVEFQAFLDKVRASRPRFKKFLQKQWKIERREIAERGGRRSTERSRSSVFVDEMDPSLNLTQMAQRLSKQSSHAHFLAYLANEKASSSPSSTTLSPYPHPNAGLSYTPKNNLQTMLTYPTLPGRVIATRAPQNPLLGRSSSPLPASAIAVGGSLAEIGNNKIGNEKFQANSLHLDRLAKGDQDPNHGEVKVRIHKAEVYAPPRVVGKHNGLGGAEIRMDAVEETGRPQIDDKLYNPHRPGSKAYVAFDIREIWMAAQNGRLLSLQQEPSPTREGFKSSLQAAQDSSDALIAELSKIKVG